MAQFIIVNLFEKGSICGTISVRSHIEFPIEMLSSLRSFLVSAEESVMHAVHKHTIFDVTIPDYIYSY